MQPAVTSRAPRFVNIIAVLAVAGVMVSSVSLYHHYGTDAASYCDFGQSFNCDIVNRSTYSTIFGIPVALIGVVGYAMLLVLATVFRSKPEVPGILLLAAVGGLGFALYLTYIEAFVLGVWCILCLSSLAVMVGITAVSALLLLCTLRKTNADYNSGKPVA